MALLAIGAPLMFQIVLAEISFGNKFIVETTEGRTDEAAHETGERQGNVMSCTSSNIVSTLLAFALQKRDILYQVQISEKMAGKDPKLFKAIDSDKMGSFYVDDSGIPCRGKDEMFQTTKILGYFSIISRIGINGPKSFFNHMAPLEKLVDFMEICAWDRDNQTVQMTGMERIRGDGFNKSLGIIVGEFAEVHQIQDAHVSRKIDSALSRVASKRGLTKIEMETFMSAVGNASVLYDVLSSNCSLYIIRRAMKRQIAIISCAFGIRRSDRKAVLFAPVRLGGNAQRYLMCEIVCNLVRELIYFLNSFITSGLLAQTRFLQQS